MNQELVFEAIHGWGLLVSEDSKEMARLWLSKVRREIEYELSISLKAGMSRSACVHADIINKSVVEYETAYAVSIPDGRFVYGIAPTPRSAQYRVRKLLRHGQCAAAGVRPESTL